MYPTRSERNPRTNTEAVVGMERLRLKLTEWVGRAFFRGERIVITDYGKEVGAFIGREELTLLRSLEREDGLRKADAATVAA